MDLTLEERAQELQEAFIRHIRHLQKDYERQLSQLPRAGKAVETTADISREQSYTSRVAFFESCIQNTTLIASKCTEWTKGLGGDESSDCILIDLGTPQGPVQEVGDFAPDDDTPFMNPFTGKMVVPTTRFTAGPSGSENPFSDSCEISKSPASSAISTGQTSVVRTSVVYPKIQPPTPAPFVKRNPFSDKQPVRTIPVSLQATGKRNEDHTGFIDSMMPPKASFSQDSARNIDNNFDKAMQEAQRLQDELDNEARLNQLAISRMQAQAQAEETLLQAQRIFAQQIANAEQENMRMLHNSFEVARRLDEQWKTERDHALEATRRIQRQWDTENARLEEQRRYAQQVQLEEQRKAELARRDMELAQRLQREWGNGAGIHPKPRGISGGNGVQRGVAETLGTQRLIEREQQRKIKEKQNSWEFSSESESGDGIIGEKINFSRPILAKQPPLQRQQPVRLPQQKPITQQPLRQQPSLYPQQQKASPLLECLACMESFKMTEMCVFICSHAYCKDCTKEAFAAALKSKTPLKCCGRIIPISPATRFLSATFISSYNLLILESTTRKPKYCVKCSTFIPSVHIHGTIGTCTKCRWRTCTLCGKKEHAGVCAEDKEGKELLRLATQKGWKSCPRCSRVVDKVDGCLHMTCKCGHQWCWSCLKDWGKCGSRCPR